MSGRKPLSSVNPFFYRVSVFLHRMIRRVRWLFSRDKFASSRSGELFPESIVKHRSILMRKLQGTDQVLQRNKITSLKTASSYLDGIIISPGEVFSFWKLVGNPLAKRNFKPGLQLSFGELVSMVGGGLCQLSNLLHWMVLHTPMEVVERHRHDFDPFPDYRRTVPFGTGATVFYNYLDFMFRNTTRWRFQLVIRVDEEYLMGEIRCEYPLPVSYTVDERNHRFVRIGDKVYRDNELWRIERDAESSEVLSEKIIMRNHAEVRYDVSGIPDIETVELE